MEEAHGVASRCWPWRLIWALLWLALFAFAGLRLWQQRRFVNEVGEWSSQSSRAAREAAAQEMREKLHDLIGSSQREIEQAINGGRPIRVDSVSRQLRHGNFVDPRSQHTFRLFFGRTTVLTVPMADWTFRGAVETGAHPPQPDRVWNALETVRGHLAGNALFVWVAMLAFAIAVPPVRRLAACAMVFLTVAGAVGWALGPMGFAHVPNDLIPDEYHGTEAVGQWQWLAIMGAVSIPVLFWAYRKPKPDEPLCWECGYNLTANTSGICPGCGKRIPPALRWLISQRPTGDPTQRFRPDEVEVADLIDAGNKSSSGKPET